MDFKDKITDKTKDLENNLFGNSIAYLHNISNAIPNNAPALKSFYSTKRRLMEARSNNYLPGNASKVTARCQRCLISFGDGPASYRISNEKKSNFAQKLIKKYKNDQAMTRYQFKYFRKLKNFDGNELTIQCKFCKKEGKICMKKPEKCEKINDFNTPTIARSRKKKNKRDKYCGLNKAIVNAISVTVDPPIIADFIPLETEKPLGKKSKKKACQKLLTTGKLTKDQIDDNKRKIKNKGKLSSMLSNDKYKKRPSTNLKHFLQDL